MKLLPATRKMIQVITIAASILIVGGATLYFSIGTLPSIGALPFALGVILTSSLNVLKILLLERSVKKTVEIEDPNAGKNYIRIQYLLRYFLTAVILLVAGLTPFISVWGAIAGIFTLQIAVIAVRSMKLEESADEGV